MPEGVIAEPVVSRTEGDTSKAVKLKIVTDKAAASKISFRIVASVAAPEDSSPMGKFTAKYRLNEVIAVEDLWLTAVAAKIPRFQM